jgi:hypothetical protein
MLQSRGFDNGKDQIGIKGMDCVSQATTNALHGKSFDNSIITVEASVHDDEEIRLYNDRGDLDLEALQEKSGFSRRRYKDAIFKGELIGGKRHGEGTMRYKSGQYYEGEWKDDKRHGKGFERLSNKNTFKGTFLFGKASGRGIYRWVNGDIYDGNWAGGKKHGYGVWKRPTGESYVGEWRNSYADGYGVQTWANGKKIHLK